MATQTTQSVLRGMGGRKKDSGVTPAPFVLALTFSFDPTQSAATVSKTLPSGAIVLDVITDGGATGGTSPTVDIGWSGNTDALANEQPADSVKSAVANGTLGASGLSALSQDREVYAGVGASAATGGTVQVTILYVPEDNGTLNG